MLTLRRSYGIWKFCILMDWCNKGEISRSFENVSFDNSFFTFFSISLRLTAAFTGEFWPWHMSFASSMHPYPYLWLHHAICYKFQSLSMRFVNKYSLISIGEPISSCTESRRSWYLPLPFLSSSLLKKLIKIKIYGYTTGILSREGFFTRIQMNELFNLMLYDGGERSTVTKYETCILSKHKQSAARGRKTPNTLRPWFRIKVGKNFYPFK